MSVAWQTALVALSFLVAVCACALVLLIRRVQALKALIPSASVRDTADEARIRLRLASTHPTLVVFLTDTCAACRGMVGALNELQQTLETGEFPLSAHVLLAGDRERFVHRTMLAMATLQSDMETYRELGISGTPESVLYAKDGTVVARGHPVNTELLADFLESALGYRPLAPTPDPPKTARAATDGDERFISQPTLARGSEPPKEGKHHE